ncbi:MAG TPA: DUF416 family protein [Candidatus Binatia bacterium]|nr:DUF416 family protein [Candidatus Binatia bacterium]
MSRLRPEARVAFAALAAERLLPYYRQFHAETRWGSAGPLERAIDLAWEHVTIHRVSHEVLHEACGACELVVPDTDDFSTPLASRALDAASAALSALRACENPAPEIAAAAAESAWEAAFGAAQLRHAVNPDGVLIATPKQLTIAAASDLVRREEAAQSGALRRLASIALTDETVRELRREFASASP